jgi:S1-C subfamily serine protease
MRSILAALLLSTASAAYAGQLPSDPVVTINDMINATNFVVANQCSGTLISLKYKLVLTNDHCLSGYVDKVTKDETGKDGAIDSKTREVYKDMELKQKSYKDFEEVSASTFQAKILFHSAKYDLALLKIKSDAIPQTLASHVLPDSKHVQRGDKVYVVGNPLLLDANLNEGVISSVNRLIHWDETNEDVHYYGVDAGINPGNSGGSLYNADLDLIGVPGATMRGASGLGFAIPAETIRTFLTEHCYESVWNDKADDKETCEKGKLDKANEIRVKAGLQPIEAPKEQDSLSGEGTVVHATKLDIRVTPPVTPAPAQNFTPAPKTMSQVFLNWVDSFGFVQK